MYGTQRCHTSVDSPSPFPFWGTEIQSTNAPYSHHTWALTPTCEAPLLSRQGTHEDRRANLRPSLTCPSVGYFSHYIRFKCSTETTPSITSIFPHPAQKHRPDNLHLLWAECHPEPSRSKRQPQELLSFGLTEQGRLQPKDSGRPTPGRTVLRVKKNHPTGRDDPSTHPDTPEPKRTWWIFSVHYTCCQTKIHLWSKPWELAVSIPSLMVTICTTEWEVGWKRENNG